MDKTIVWGNAAGIAYSVLDWFGHGSHDLLVHTSSTASWQFYCPMTGETESFTFGPVGAKPAWGKFDDGRTKAVAYSDGAWYVKDHDATTHTGPFFYGLSTDVPISEFDANNDGIDARTILRDNNTTYDSSASTTSFGIAGDIFFHKKWRNTQGSTIGVYRPSTGQWFVRNPDTGLVYPEYDGLSYGLATDIPIVGDWTGNGRLEVGLVRTSSGKIFLHPDTEGLVWGDMTADKFLTGDFDKDGLWEIATWKSGTFTIKDVITFKAYYGSTPVTAAYFGSKRVVGAIDG